MADPTTTNRGYAIPLRGSDVGTWDVPVNGDFALIDQNLGAVSTVALSNSSVVLNAAQYACGTIVLTGALTASVSVNWPSVQGWWTVSNQTTGNFYVQLACGAGRRVCVDQGATWDIQLDGTNVSYRNFPAVGTYLDIADATLPLWVSGCTGALPYLNCDGSTFSGATYPYLAAKLGGTTLPDLRGVSRATLNQGTSRITTSGSGINGDTRFSRGGSQNWTLSLGQMPQHTHAATTTNSSSTFTLTFTPSYYSVIDQTNVIGVQTASNANVLRPTGTNVPTATIPSGALSLSTSLTYVGSSDPHLNMQPTTISGITLIRAG